MATSRCRYSILYGLGFYLLSALFYFVASRRLERRTGDRLGREARIEPVGLPQQGRPGEHVGAELEADLALLGGDFGRALRRVVEIVVAGRQRQDLRLAGALEEIDA